MQVNFDPHHDNPGNCQLQVCITGSKEFVLQKLKEMVSEIETSADKKPVQGRYAQGGGHAHIIVPWWVGRRN